MPTTLTRFVNTASTAGGDGTTNSTTGGTRAFASLSEALAALNAVGVRNFVANDTDVEVVCTGATADTTAVDLNSFSFTTDATRRLTIRAAAGDVALLTGWSTGRYRLSVTNTAPLHLRNTSLVRVVGLQVEMIRSDGTSASRVVFADGTSSAITVELDAVRIRYTASSINASDENAIIGGEYSATYRARNAILEAVGTDRAKVSGGYDYATSTAPRFYNCLFRGGNKEWFNPGYAGAAAPVFINTLWSDWAADRSGSAGAASDYNASERATAPGSNSRNSQTFTFASAPAGDFSLAGSDAGARNFGVSLASDPTWAFSTDMAGTSRPQGAAWDIGPSEYAVAASPALVFVTQPSTTASGYVMSPAPVVRMTTDGSTTDTGFTGNITATLIGAGGVLLGTTTVAASAGVATFSALRPCIAGTYTLRFSASGVSNLDSASFTVTSGTGATLTGGDMPDIEIRRNEGTAALRRIPLLIEDDAGAAWAGSVTGVKAKLSQNFGSETDSPADIVRVAGKLHYVEVAQAYSDIAEGGKIIARVPAASGRREALGIGKIIPADSYAAAVNETSLKNGIVRALNGADGYIVEKDPANAQIVLTIPGGGTVEIPARFVENSAPVDAIGTT